jgi:hypothetical protein
MAKRAHADRNGLIVRGQLALGLGHRNAITATSGFPMFQP